LLPAELEPALFALAFPVFSVPAVLLPVLVPPSTFEPLPLAGELNVLPAFDAMVPEFTAVLVPALALMFGAPGPEFVAAEFAPELAPLLLAVVIKVPEAFPKLVGEFELPEATTLTVLLELFPVPPRLPVPAFAPVLVPVFAPVPVTVTGGSAFTLLPAELRLRLAEFPLLELITDAAVVTVLFVPALLAPALMVPALFVPALLAPALMVLALFVPAFRVPELLAPVLSVPALLAAVLTVPELFTTVLMVPVVLEPELSTPVLPAVLTVPVTPVALTPVFAPELRVDVEFVEFAVPGVPAVLEPVAFPVLVGNDATVPVVAVELSV
jgi:hypothetical protein